MKYRLYPSCRFWCGKVPPGAEDWGDQLGSKTMEIAPTGMVVGIRATRRSSRHRPFDDVESTGRFFECNQLSSAGHVTTPISGKNGSNPFNDMLLLCEQRG